MSSFAVVGCGGAGLKFLKEACVHDRASCIGINDSNANIVVNRKDALMVNSVYGELAFEVFPWLNDFSSKNLVVLSGLGGIVGSNISVLIGKAMHDRANVYGLFSEPFSFESPERSERARIAKENIMKYYRGVIFIPNDPLSRYYSNLSMIESMKIHGIIMKHIINDFRTMILNEDTSFRFEGSFGFGIGFGTGKDRINLAIQDALDSPWINGEPKYAFFSGEVDKEDIALAVRDYPFKEWYLYRTKEYGDEIKVTVLSR